MTDQHRLGDLQLAIMRILWERGEATVAEVHDSLVPQRDLALTTIATMLRKMEDKGVVAHRAEGRQFIYQAVVRERDVKRTMLSELRERLFAGDPAAMVSHLLREEEISGDELSRLRALIADLERARGEDARDARKEKPRD